MNKIYRLIWNPALHAWVAVSEFAKANGKGKAGRKSLSATTVGIIGALTLLPMVSASAYADDPDSVKMGTNAVTGETTILDANTITTGNTNVNEQTLSNVAIGESANAAMGGTALGDHANADTSTSSTPGGSVAIGAYATANKSGGATAIGLASEADGQNSVAFGAGAHANRSGDIAIGHGSTSGTYTSTQTTDDAEGENISFGNLSTAYGGHALAVGNNVAATAAYSMALGIGSQASGVKSLSIGSDAKSSAEHSLAIGSDAAASGENAQAIGGSATASGETSLAIGNHASATDKQSFAVGYKAQSTKADAVAIGTQAKAQADRALSFGYNSSATKSDAVAMGSNAKSQGMSSLAFGTNAISANANSVALGSNSLTEAAVATQDITINDKIYAFAGTAPLSTVSIGKKDAERTLTNVAAGRISNTSTDAINGSQLFAATQATDALGDIAVKYDLNPDGSANYDSITLGGTAYDSVGETGGTAITNVARGVDESDAVNMSQLNETNADVADITTVVNNIAGDTTTIYTDANGKGIRYARTNETGLTAADAFANGKGSSAVGYNATATGENSLALGYNAKANNAKDVALGADSTTAAAVATTGTTIRGTDYTFAGTAPVSTLSIGSVGQERTLTNLAAGRLSATSTDAVNGSQLYATNQAIEGIADLQEFAVMYDTNPDGTVNHNSVSMGGTAYDSAAKTGGTTITNVARGVDDSDAVNMSQLNETNAGVADITTVVNNIAGDTTTTYTDANGKGIRYARTNETGLTETDAFANGKGSSAVGYNATATGENSLALGYNAKANNAKDVALGADSTTAAAVATTGTTILGTDYTFAGTAPVSTLSIGSVGNERTLTNLAAGRLSATSTDAVNGSQLYATNQAIVGVSDDLSDLSDLAVKYDTNPDGTVNLNSVTLGGTAYDSAAKTGGTTITNVARGVNDSDAVNMSQLNETDADVADITNIVNDIAGDTSATYTDQNGTGIRYARTNETGLTAADAFANGKGSSAVGYNATATGENSLALGYNAKANNAKDVALGADSTTAAAVATTGTTIRGTDYTFAGTAPVSTLSIGSAGNERTLTNLAAGRLSATSTDAVNGSQLFATNQAIEGISGDISDLSDLAVKYDTNPDGTVNYNSVTMGGTAYDSATKTGGTTLSNVAYGVNDSDAVNVQQLRDATSDMYNNGVMYFHANSSKADSVATGNDSIAVGPAAQSVGESSIAMGNSATSTGAGSMAMGQNAQSTGENSVAIGAGAVANNTGDVALGAGASTEQAVGTQGVTLRGTDYQFAGTAPAGTVSVGSLDNERTITNVAAGRISATSTDAVNGSQLYATNQAIENINTNFSGLENSAVKYVVNGDGTVDYNKVALAGDSYDQSTKTGGTSITNVAAGVNASDAVNKQQLDEVSLNVTNIAEGKEGMFQVNNTSNLPKPKPTGQNATAGGAGAVASATNSMALGNNAKATHANSVALGTNSVTDRDNTISVGYAGGERQIANVAAGTAATDAVNVSQLKQSVGDSYTYTNNKFGELKDMIADQDDKLSAGIAGAMAMASLPQPYSAGASMFSMAGGTYQGESAIAMGVSAVSDNGKWVTKLSGSTNSQGDVGGSVGVGYQW